MKHLTIVLMSMALLLTLGACGGDDSQAKSSDKPAPKTANPITPENAAQLTQWKILGGYGRLSFSADGTRLASKGPGDTLLIWDISTGEVNQTFKANIGFMNVGVLSPDGTRAAYMDNELRLGDVATGETTHVLQGHSDVVTRMAFSPDGKWLATASRDAEVRLWDVNTAETVHILEGHKDSIGGLEFSPDGSQLITLSSGDQTVYVWDVATGEQSSSFTVDNTLGVKISQDGKILLSFDQSGALQRWDIATGEKQLETPVQVCPGSVSALAFNPDDSLLAIGCSDGDVKMWDAALTSEISAVHAHGKYVSSIGFSKDGSTLLTTGSDNVIWLWKVGEESAAVKPRPGRWASLGIESEMFLSNEIKASFEIQPDGSMTGLILTVPVGFEGNACELSLIIAPLQPDGTLSLTDFSPEPIRGRFINETTFAGVMPSAFLCNAGFAGVSTWNAVWVGETK